MMIAVAACFLCSIVFGLRLVSLIGFIPLMLLVALAAFALQGAAFGVLVLVVLQVGYFSGLVLHALFSGPTARPALRRGALRRASLR
jgi:hypothetical protein